VPKGRHADTLLIVVVTLLAGAGLVFLYSSSALISEREFKSAHQMLVSQAIKLAFGAGLLVLVSRLDYRRLQGGVAWGIWAGALVLLLLVAIPNPLRVTIRHATRWLCIGSFVIQPSEFARVAIALAIASVAAAPGAVWTDRRRLAGIAVAVLPPIGLILLQPNFGTAVVIGVSVVTLLVIAGLPWRWLVTGGGGLAVAGGLLTLVYRYPLERIQSWIAGLGNVEALPFQVRHGLIALGSGGVLGVGLGQSLQKRLFVPDPHTDLILAIIGEETGFVGVTALLTLFAILLWRGYRIARSAPDRFGSLLAAGVIVQIGFYLIINAGVATGLLPVTGLPLPFVSYGGSALLANLVSIGILLSVSRAARWRRVASQPRVMEIGFSARRPCSVS
jgi:cell division protein FtsW